MMKSGTFTKISSEGYNLKNCGGEGKENSEGHGACMNIVSSMAMSKKHDSYSQIDNKSPGDGLCPKVEVIDLRISSTLNCL